MARLAARMVEEILRRAGQAGDKGGIHERDRAAGVSAS
jgi:hypothetical protein